MATQPIPSRLILAATVGLQELDDFILTLRSNRVIDSERRGTPLQSVKRTISDSFRRKSLHTNSEIADMTEVRPRTAFCAAPTVGSDRAVSCSVADLPAWCVATALGRIG